MGEWKITPSGEKELTVTLPEDFQVADNGEIDPETLARGILGLGGNGPLGVNCPQVYCTGGYSDEQR